MSAENQRKHLYLLEVVVKKININATVLLKSYSFDPSQIEKLPTIVKAQFSDIFFVEIDKLANLYVDRKKSQKEIKHGKEKSDKSSAEVGGGDEEEISGKSCLYPLSSEQMEIEVKRSPLYIDCFTRSEGNMSPILLGRTKISLGTQFYNTVCSARNSSCLPATINYETVHQLSNVFGDNSGNIEIAVRLSCFGNALLSDFSTLSPVIPGDVVNKDKYIKEVQNNCKFYRQESLSVYESQA